jgi:hypothetical protein
MSRSFSLEAVILVALGTGALLASGCSSERVITPRAAPQENVRSSGYSDRDWAWVLRTYVRDGLVDYDGLARNRIALDQYTALIARVGPTATPEQFPSAAERTAYWINAYNALVLLAVLDVYPVSTMYDLSLPRLEWEYWFQVDGRKMNLAQVEEAMLDAGRNDVRALFATSRAAMGTPRLGAEPIRPETLDRQLAEAAATALDNPHLLRVDDIRQSVLVWQLVLEQEERFREYWHVRRRVRTSYLFNILLELASAQRRRALQSAVGYTLRPIPFDRTLNRWTRGDTGRVP